MLNQETLLSQSRSSWNISNTKMAGRLVLPLNGLPGYDLGPTSQWQQPSAMSIIHILVWAILLLTTYNIEQKLSGLYGLLAQLGILKIEPETAGITGQNYHHWGKLINPTRFNVWYVVGPPLFEKLSCVFLWIVDIALELRQTGLIELDKRICISIQI